jgi:VWFA-related protein
VETWSVPAAYFHQVRGSGILALAVVLPCLGQETPLFRAGIHLVRVDVEVARDGQIIEGLKAADFAIKDNGEPQPLAHFGFGEEPLDVMLLIDISGSMAPSVEKVGRASRRAFAELREGDRVGVMVFYNDTRMVQPLTADLTLAEVALTETVPAMRLRGGTDILGGIQTAVRTFLGQPRSERRRALVVITDNVGQRRRRVSSVVTDAWEADVTVCGLLVRGGLMHSINTISRITSPHIMLFQVGMGSVAEQTGGELAPPGDPAERFTALLRRLRQRYNLYYQMPPGKPGEKRQVVVGLSPEAKARHSGARVRTRKGYHVPATPAQP